MCSHISDLSFLFGSLNPPLASFVELNAASLRTVVYVPPQFIDKQKIDVTD